MVNSPRASTLCWERHQRHEKPRPPNQLYRCVELNKLLRRAHSMLPARRESGLLILRLG